MLNIIYTITPIFFLISLGYIFHRRRTFTEGFWSGVEHLCYYVLFPSLIIRTLAITDFSQFPALNVSLTMGASVAAMLVVVSLGYFIAKPMGMAGASYSSIFQGATRWNTFAVIAIIDGFYGDAGVSVASIGIAVMIPMLNVSNVTALALMVGKDTPSIGKVIKMLVTNPFIIACSTGLALNFLGVGLWQPVANTMDLLGRAALALSLLAVGVGVQFSTIKRSGFAVLIATILKLALMPLFMFLFGSYFGVTGMALTVAILCGAVPTAGASYILARKMGGDATLMANILTVQTLVSIVSITAILYYIGV
ncbi:MAG: AEC family transporter [OCS116 cluster bacterium]|uniref:Transporter n=1 Tax=OCS116 cluster bacterium TaxID=2030921 RepID=A0A2A4YRF4_9PROT|nr:AEC family transporter [OCS116 cluster bacterium]